MLANINIQSLTASFIIFVIPIVVIWTTLLKSTGIWTDLVPEYKAYYSTIEAYALDYFFVLFYVMAFIWLVNRLGQQSRPKWMLLVAFFAWVAILDMTVATLLPTTDGRYASFLRKWAKKAGWRAIIWDFLYILAIVAIACYLPQRVVSANEFWIVLSLVLIVGLIRIY
jgi:flagellar biogenesis protein FliO